MRYEVVLKRVEFLPRICEDWGVKKAKAEYKVVATDVGKGGWKRCKRRRLL